MRITLASLALLLSSLILLNCDGSGREASANDKSLIDTDFDELRGWIDNTAGSLSNKEAYSGRYSLTVGGGGQEYGTTFMYPLGELTAVKPRKLHVQAWVKKEAATRARLVVEVINPATDERVFWQAVDLFESGVPGKWTKAETDLIMPDAIAFNHILKIYMWANAAPQPVFLDDLRITSAD